MNKIGLFTYGKRFECSSNSITTNDAGLPTKRFIKDIIHPGTYTHPVHKWELSVDSARMDKWVKNFELMQDNGIDVEVVVDHKRNAESVRGYVKDIFEENGILFCSLEAIGDKSIELAGIVKNVSVLIDPDFKDGKGNDYGEVISHVSIVQQPIVPGQSGFVAASKDNKENGEFNTIPIYFNTGDSIMNEEVQKKYRELFKFSKDEEVTEEMVFESTEKLALSIGDSTTKIAELEKTNKELSKKAEAKPKDNEKLLSKIDPNLAEQMGSIAEQQLSLLVSEGKLTPAARDKAAELFIGKQGDRQLMALSIGDKGTSSVFSKVVEILKTNDISKLPQPELLALSRNVPGDEEKEFSKDTNKEMIEMAS